MNSFQGGLLEHIPTQREAVRVAPGHLLIQGNRVQVSSSGPRVSIAIHRTDGRRQPGADTHKLATPARPQALATSCLRRR
ncbi:hypothetical protein Pcinc_001848 [Petrolisthes cinctipes]|uniref:Uncharacterized protein n=1 Tax=Petrolisthes cinctipes TaxID=88211 RepID=A0AAE1GJC1_PETCI|nr:hypothetical protein Pcinc_001848 [Petrolisthes cinctipes]